MSWWLIGLKIPASMLNTWSEYLIASGSWVTHSTVLPSWVSW